MCSQSLQAMVMVMCFAQVKKMQLGIQLMVTNLHAQRTLAIQVVYFV